MAKVGILVAGLIGGPAFAETEHFPLVPVGPFKISAVFSDSGGIDIIEVRVVWGEAVRCPGSARERLLPCRKDPQAVSYTCNYHPYSPKNSAVECPIDLAGFPGGTLVSYSSFAARESGGSRQVLASDPELTFLVGEPSKGDEDILRPVLWSRTEDRLSKLDVAFYPSSDSFSAGSTDPNFRNSISELMDGLRGGSRLSEPLTGARRTFNLWIGYEGDIIAPGVFFLGAGPKPHLDSSIVLHSNHGIGDRSQIRLGGGQGSVIVGNTIVQVFFHELGHMLFGLGDEYCDGDQDVTADCGNVFRKKERCEKEAQNWVGATCDCVQCPSKPSPDGWRVVTKLDKDESIMSTISAKAVWYSAAVRCIERRIKECTLGQCY